MKQLPASDAAHGVWNDYAQLSETAKENCVLGNELVKQVENDEEFLRANQHTITSKPNTKSLNNIKFN